jgi:hypothetical protein
MVDQISTKDKDIIEDTLDTQFTPRKTEAFQDFKNFTDDDIAQVEEQLDRNIEEYQLTQNAGRELSEVIAERAKDAKITIDEDDINLKAAMRRIFNTDPKEITFNQFKECVDAQLDIINIQSQDILDNARQQVMDNITADGDISSLIKNTPEANIVSPLNAAAFQQQMTQQMYMMLFPFMAKDFRGQQDCTTAHTSPLPVTGSAGSVPITGIATQVAPTTAITESTGATYRSAVTTGKQTIDATVKPKG